MRIIAVVFVLLISAPAFAQEWIEYFNREDMFGVNLPGQPTISETTWQPQRGKALPGRVYSVQAGRERYSVTVVNLAGVNEPSDLKGSIAWEAWNFRKRGGEVSYDGYAQVDRIEGHQLHITNRDKTMTFAGIYLHARRLYILEATVPAEAPGALLFQYSLSILDEKGVRIRYELDADGNRKGRVGNYAAPEGR